MGLGLAFAEVHEAFTIDGLDKGVGELVVWMVLVFKCKAIGTMLWLFFN